MAVTWTVVIPVKVLAQAKSRLGVLAGPRRPELAMAMATDTASAVLGCPDVARVVVVTSDVLATGQLSSLGVIVVPDPAAPLEAGAPAPGERAGSGQDERAGSVEDGLNAALAHGALVAATQWPGTGIAALSADLPALRPAELSRALRAAAALPAGRAAFIADEQGVGTTMYAAAPGADFLPMFGGASRRRHAASGACELLLDGIPGLRRDVDTPDDLRTAVGLGAGPRTMAVAEELLDVA
jgi:2-phospho-L-lactate/phosphoenolpyruvate guanylyltransferase